MNKSFSLKMRSYYPWLFIALLIIFNLIGFIVLSSRFNADVCLSIIGAVAAFIHFLYSQHNKNTDIFITLFRDFNLRYDLLNNRLNKLFNKDTNTLFSQEERNLLFDYFNLCAEEYLFFEAGYIDKDVWNSWLNGMRFFASNKQILDLWQGELKTNSYYGFSLSFIKHV